MAVQTPHDHDLKIPCTLSSFAQQGCAANFVGQKFYISNQKRMDQGML